MTEKHWCNCCQRELPEELWGTTVFPKDEVVVKSSWIKIEDGCELPEVGEEVLLSHDGWREVLYWGRSQIEANFKALNDGTAWWMRIPSETN